MKIYIYVSTPIHRISHNLSEIIIGLAPIYPRQYFERKRLVMEIDVIYVISNTMYEDYSLRGQGQQLMGFLGVNGN